ncbi:MAG: hypothetical protein ACM34K_19425 [Bacillota bacterium]
MNSIYTKKLDKDKLIRKIRLQEEQINEMRVYIEALRQMVNEKHSIPQAEAFISNWNIPNSN